MDQETKIKLLQQTSEAIAQKYAEEMMQIQDKHGAEFAGLVMANVSLNFLIGVLSSVKEEGRFDMMLAFAHALFQGLNNELAAQEVEDLIERIRKGSNAKPH
jgi:hypothetical protein